VASYVSGDGTDTLNFDFTPTSAHEVSDLEYVNIISLTLNGGTVLDAGLNNANLTLPILGGAGSLGFNKEIAIFTPEPSPSSSSGSRPRPRSVINTYIPPVDIIPIDISPIESTDKNCTEFTKDIKLGLATNDSNEIKLWQAFLNKNFDAKLVEDGIYGKMTLQAVKNFQTKYAEEILAPWGLVRATGFIHKTTRSKANNILGCPTI
jgi:peptidoglycan hydrolase-like protein with peptidoglycan-binding domain